MSLTLGPLFDQPLHPTNWQRPSSGAGTDDFRVTGSFYGRDLVNGGTHGATDVGNGRTGNPVLMPASCPVRALHHFDSALGLEWMLGGGWFMEAWHLGSTLLAMPARPGSGTARSKWYGHFQRGEMVGRTGATGSRVQIGGVWQPMPAHTHVQITHNGERVDPERYLQMVGRKQTEMKGADDEMGKFVDVKDSAWYAGVVQRGVDLGIANGVSATHFAPERSATRAEVLAMVLNAHDLLDAKIARATGQQE